MINKLNRTSPFTKRALACLPLFTTSFKVWCAITIALLLPLAASAADWPQWRGVQRDGISAEVPQALGEKQLCWRKPLAGDTHAGVVVSGKYLIVPDHGQDQDIIRCFTADTGEVVWTQTYPCKAEMDYGACPRATPLIAGDRVYTLSALGGLHCYALATGKEVWKLDLPATFKAELPQWGYSSSPLLADGKLIVNPGGAQAALVALDPATAQTFWQTPGKPAAYNSFITGAFGGKSQLVGFDKEALGGWDIATGKRLWTLKPENDGDFFVGTPVNVDGKLLVASDTNATRLYAFTAQGADHPQTGRRPATTWHPIPPPRWSMHGLVFGPSGGLVCLDAAAGLKTLWRLDSEDALNGYDSLIAGDEPPARLHPARHALPSRHAGKKIPDPRPPGAVRRYPLPPRPRQRPALRARREVGVLLPDEVEREPSGGPITRIIHEMRLARTPSRASGSYDLALPIEGIMNNPDNYFPRRGRRQRSRQ